MKLFRAVLLNAIFFLNVLLLFLAAFHRSLVAPVWVQVTGRFHALVLHMPIGLMVLLVLLVIFRKGFKKKSFHNFQNFVLYFLAFTASLAAVLGVLLSAEGGYNTETLYRHLVTGTIVSILSAVLLGISLYLPDNQRVFNFTLFLSTLVLILAGHFGTLLTHGDNFIWAPLEAPYEEPVVNDSTPLYRAAILPVLEHKCAGCHNERKAKGKLVILPNGTVRAGGTNGPLWIAGDANGSNAIKRTTLPEDHKDHMPPSGKMQLTEAEKTLLFLWIAKGADVNTAWTRFDRSDTLMKVAHPFIHTSAATADTHYPFVAAGEALINSLNTPFCTVASLSANEPALTADFYLKDAYDPKRLEALTKVSTQLVQLNLSKMPVHDQDLSVVAKFTSLEKLNLNNTAVSGKTLNLLRALTHLTSLSLTGTSVDKTSMTPLGAMPSLRQVYVWNTKISADEVVALRKEFPTISWETGVPATDVLKLTPPLLVNEDVFLDANELVRLKNNLPGTDIRYTVDGSEPDSVRGLLYQGPIALKGYTLLKAKSFKSGWYGSDLSRFSFFRAGITPATSALASKPDKDYKGQGITTLVDGKKGAADGFKDLAWLGFRDEPLRAEFTFPKGQHVSRITISYGENAGAYILPPASVEVWQGADKAHAKLLAKVIPLQPTAKGETQVKGIIVPISPVSGGYVEILAHPLARVPVWVTEKKEKAWLFVDEVIFE